MKIQSIGLKRRKQATIAVALTLLTAGCTSQTATKLPNTSPSDRPEIGLSHSPQPIVQPMPSTGALQPVPVPRLIPATAIPERLPEVATGRPDPFSALLMPPTLVTQAQPAVASALPLPSVPLSAMPSAEPTSRSLPTFQPSNGSLPAVTPSAALISLAQAIEVSGVVQVGSGISIIVKVPDEQTSRYVRVGDRLANGIWVKRVEMGAEPVVVLEQDGSEVLKTIGAL